MNEQAQSPEWIAFDGVEIDVLGHRLIVAGKPTALEPKSFAVLVLLARQPGRVFTRDEILDAVWGHRHVTPGVINRTVTLLRQALGESGGETRYLHTIHGVGYRLDATLRERTPAVVAITASLGSAAPIEPAPSDAAPPRTGRGVPRQASRRRLAVAALVLLAIVAAGAAIVIALARRPVPVTATTPTLIVLPLRAVGSDPDETVLAEGLSEELITRLARADGLRVISSLSARTAQAQSLDPAQLARRTGTTHALEGSLRQNGTALRIDLRLIQLPAGRTLWAQSYDRDLADALALEREIAQSVVASLALQLQRDDAREPVDPEVFREYLAVRVATRDAQPSAAQAESRQRLRGLVARAPAFARAHGMLARLLASHEAGVTRTPEELDEARREAARALELDPNQTEAYVARAMLACREQDWAACQRELGRALELDPADSVSRTDRALWLANLGYLDEALAEIELAVASDPLDYKSHVVQARVLDTSGRHDAAERALTATAQLGESAPRQLVYARWFNAVWRGDLAAAHEYADAMPPEAGFREASLAVVDALGDPTRWPQARSAIEASERKSGYPNLTRAMLPDAASQSDTIMRAFEVPLRTLTSSYGLSVWNPEYAALRRTPAFQDFLKRNRLLDYWRTRGFPPQCRADGDGARCD